MNLHDYDLTKKAKAEGILEGILEGKREGILEGKREGILEGILEANRQTAKNLLQKNIPVEIISESTGLSEEEISKLAEEN